MAEPPVNKEKKHIFDNPRNVKRLLWALYSVSGLLFLADFFIDRRTNYDHPWEIVPGFHAIYGFVACVALVLIATQLRKLLMRGEDYYDK